ncbi:MAG TPA: deoxyguanosinetriphosphate triphosphohydrolase [Syntrophorhabdaceae bacterium]|jgi:dGTPase
MNIRERLEKREELILSPFAQRSSRSRGRLKAEKECDIRPAFQHDRDRITHCKAFRRLKHKSQVFLSPASDHYRTRLTHTIEVSQIARTVAKALDLNEDLVEAIALGHDLGHTPFGHAGEDALSKIHAGGFHHYEQSLRVVDLLEKDGQGLNLTLEVRDGILKHSKGKGEIVLKGDQDRPLTQEAEVVRFADIIAYINHDIDDATRGGIITREDVPRDCVEYLGNTSSERIDTMVRGVLAASAHDGAIELTMDEELEHHIKKLRSFLYERVYDNTLIHGDFIKCTKIIKELYHYFLENHDTFLREVERQDFYDDPAVCVCDFVASMTDRYAFNLFERIFLPMPWKIPI